MISFPSLTTTLGLALPVRVLLVEDSPVALALLKRSLANLPEIQVVGTAGNGALALEMIPKLDPHVICTDLHMPVMDGLEFTRTVMERFPKPILVISVSVQQEDRWNIFQLFEAGALDVFPKPMADWLSKKGSDFSQELARKILLLAGVNSFPCPTRHNIPLKRPLRAMPSLSMVVVGGSLGGPQVLKEIVSGLPHDFPAPILCVQHMDEMFQEDLVFWLRQHTPMAVQLASHGEVPFPGSIYFPPREHHLTLDSVGRMVCSQATPVDGQRPSITVTMESVADHFGATTIGILLSGVGNDGVRGLEAINRKGGVTIVQDEESSLVFEVPRKAIEMGAAQHVLPCSGLSQALLHLAGRSEPLVVEDHEPLALAPSPSFHNVPLLLVEDSPTQAFKLKRMLTQAGFAVTLAKDGVEGLDKALESPPTLVISDVSMPRMDGFQLCKALKSHPVTSRVPVMLLTALTNPGEILEGLSSGADNYLTKPWEESHLLAHIETLLLHAGSAREQEEGMEITFEGQTHIITSTRRQIVDLLLSTYQKAVQQNKTLMANQLELKMLNLQLVDQAARQEALNIQLQKEIQVRCQAEERQLALLVELESLNRELSDFAYVVSHDLKAPVRALGSLTNWLITDYSEKLDEDGRGLLTTLAGRAQRMEGLIHALLDYTQISRLQEELTRIDLDKLVHSILERLAIPETIDVQIVTPLPHILFDKKRVEQLFWSLLDNAVRFMDKPRGQVVITWEDKGEWWGFSVSDNGPGIDAKYHEKIFGIFQTLQARDELESAGVGLALVRKIVQKYGGELHLDSRLGGGSTFSFTLPKMAKNFSMAKPASPPDGQESDGRS